MINNLLHLLNTYQTISIIFVSTFLTVICLVSKKNKKTSSPTFNILQNDTLVVEQDIEVISLEKQQQQHKSENKSKIPIRKNQINNSITSINEKNDSKKFKQNEDKGNLKSNSFFISSNTSLSNNTPLAKTTPNSNSSTRRSFIIPKNYNEKTTSNISMPITEIQAAETKSTNNEIDIIQPENKSTIITVTPTIPTKLQNKTNFINSFPSRHFQSTFPVKPSSATTTTIANNITTKKMSPTNQTTLTTVQTNSTTSVPSTPTINSSRNSTIKTLPSKAQISEETIKTEVNTVSTIKKIEQPKVQPEPIEEKPKLKSNLSTKKPETKPTYKLLQNESSQIKKNRKSVKFHNKVEVWARTPTFLYTDKSFMGIDKEPHFYDDFDEVDILPRIKITVRPNRRLLVPSNNVTVSSILPANGYSSKLRSKIIASSTVPSDEFTDSTIPVIPTLASHNRPTGNNNNNNINRSLSFPNNQPVLVQGGTQQTFLYTPSPDSITNSSRPLRHQNIS
jgi:hypothetical protein